MTGRTLLTLKSTANVFWWKQIKWTDHGFAKSKRRLPSTSCLPLFMQLDRQKRESRQVNYFLSFQDANRLIKFSFIICHRKLEAKHLKQDWMTCTHWTGWQIRFRIRNASIYFTSLSSNVMIRALLYYCSECWIGWVINTFLIFLYYILRIFV